MITDIVLNNTLQVTSLSVNSDSTMLGVGQQAMSGCAGLSVFSLENYKIVNEIEYVDDGYIKSVCFIGNTNILGYLKGANNYVAHFFDTDRQEHKNCYIPTISLTKLSANRVNENVVASSMCLECWDIDRCFNKWKIDNNYYDPVDQYCSIADISSDGTLVAIAGNNSNIVEIRNAESAELLHELNSAPNLVQEVKINETSDFLAVLGNYSKGMYLWDLNSRKQILVELFNQSMISCTSFCFHPVNKNIAIGTLAGFINTYDLETGKKLQRIDAHESRVSALTYSRNGKILISGGYDGTVKLIEIPAR